MSDIENKMVNSGSNEAATDIIYFENSNLYIKNSSIITKKEKQEVNKGLFSKKYYSAEDIIGVFDGKVLKKNEYNILLQAGVTKQGYGIFIEKDYVLDCYMSSRQYDCLMSYANSPYKCIYKLNGKVAVDNCAIYYNKMCGLAIPDVYLIAKTNISPDDELLTLYGYEHETNSVL